MPRSLAQSVAVITGASSGIGRATAMIFAQHGATVVVAARRHQALAEVVAACEHSGTRALAVRTDVSSESGVSQLAEKAVEAFGRVDVWINNAAVTLFGRFEETPLEVYRRVIETNLFGCRQHLRADASVRHRERRLA